jgi:hypothetical protein
VLAVLHGGNNGAEQVCVLVLFQGVWQVDCAMDEEYAREGVS